jgi:predicted metal-dependent enzyme (double-stranded beta helix superfamily)
MARELGGVGSRVLFENDRVRVWELALAPGESSPVHEHHHDYVIVQLAGDRIAGAQEPDSRSHLAPYVERDVQQGWAVFVPKGGIERAVNVGRERYWEIIVELK